MSKHTLSTVACMICLGSGSYLAGMTPRRYTIQEPAESTEGTHTRSLDAATVHDLVQDTVDYVREVETADLVMKRVRDGIGYLHRPVSTYSCATQARGMITGIFEKICQLSNQYLSTEANVAAMREARQAYAQRMQELKIAEQVEKRAEEAERERARVQAEHEAEITREADKRAQIIAEKRVRELEAAVKREKERADRAEMQTRTSAAHRVESVEGVDLRLSKMFPRFIELARSCMSSIVIRNIEKQMHELFQLLECTSIPCMRSMALKNFMGKVLLQVSNEARVITTREAWYGMRDLVAYGKCMLRIMNMADTTTTAPVVTECIESLEKLIETNLRLV